MRITKADQLKYKKNLKKAPDGDKLEDTVQSAVNDHLKRRWVTYLRFPDWFWSLMVKKFRNDETIFPSLSEAFAGWADNICFYPITEKYHLCVFIENKSKTGKWSGNKQRNMSDELNYQVPRSAEKGIKIVDDFVKDAKSIGLIIENHLVGERPILCSDGNYECKDCNYDVVNDDRYCPNCGTKVNWE
ncbi:MAG: hypothetical protein V3V00_15710 [Saprospiraceae bacterium]